MTDMMGTMLGPVANLTTYMTTTQVHQSYFPYMIAPTLHAARTSIAYQNNARMTGNLHLLPWGIYLGGYLVMAWGGSVISHVLLCIPAPQMYNIHLWYNYLGVHLFLTAVFHFFPWALSPLVFDTISPLPDAVLRIGSILASLSLLDNHPNRNLATSFLPHIILGAVASSGGGTSAMTLSTWTPHWQFSTPVFLRGNGWLATLDVWSGSLMAMIYYFLTASHPIYEDILIRSNIVDKDVKGPLLTPPEARAAVTFLLAALYAYRVAVVHWIPKSQKRAPSIKRKKIE